MLVHDTVGKLCQKVIGSPLHHRCSDFRFIASGESVKSQKWRAGYYVNAFVEGLLFFAAFFLLATCSMVWLLFCCSGKRQHWPTVAFGGSRGCSGRVVVPEELMRRSDANLKITTHIRCSHIYVLFNADILLFISKMESASSQQRHNLSDLPIGALAHVSSYLALPSRALLAVALDYYRDNDSISAIVERDALDFGDIEKELAVKLTDDDVRNALLSIDAVNNLKTLRLTNLLNISGIGLEPLSGSIMIEKIDLSLAGDNESPDLSPAPPISCTEVFSILDSIIIMGGESSLKLLIFPKKWQKERNTESEFHAFLVRYNELLRSRVVTCFKCNDNLIGDGAMMQMAHYQYGTQKFTCYDCLKHYCLDCEVREDGENVYCMSALCRTCNRHYCSHCSRERVCTSCDEWFCVDCMDMKQCFGCDQNTCLNCISERGCRNNCCDGKIWCSTCAADFDVLRLCEHCNAEYCVGCYESNTDADAIYSIDYCDDCYESLCGECRVIKCKDDSDCLGCYRLAFSALLEEKERMEASRDAD